jgi:hypothetical protein
MVIGGSLFFLSFPNFDTHAWLTTRWWRSRKKATLTTLSEASILSEFAISYILGRHFDTYAVFG